MKQPNKRYALANGQRRMKIQIRLRTTLSPAASTLLAGVFLVLGTVVHAEQAKTKTSGSPLDTLMHTRLWADVPKEKDFVRDTRPPTEALGYQPLTGTDPERPKLRTKAELKALESELDSATLENDRKAGKHGTK